VTHLFSPSGYADRRNFLRDLRPRTVLRRHGACAAQLAEQQTAPLRYITSDVRTSVSSDVKLALRLRNAEASIFIIDLFYNTICRPTIGILVLN